MTPDFRVSDPISLINLEIKIISSYLGFCSATTNDRIEKKLKILNDYLSGLKNPENLTLFE